MRITVYGTPAPQGSKRHVGNGILVESSPLVKPWRQNVQYAVMEAGRIAPLSGAIRIRVIFTLKKPLSAPKRRQTWPSKKPDLDKLIRSTMDGLTESGVWIDDSQVVEIVAAKRFPNEGMDALEIPGAVIDITEIGPEPAPKPASPEKVALPL